MKRKSLLLVLGMFLVLWLLAVPVRSADFELKHVPGLAELGYVEIRGLSAGTFDPAAWGEAAPIFVPDIRAPMLEPEWTGEWRNIYAPSIVQVDDGWRLFYGAWDGVDAPNDLIYSRRTTDWLSFTESKTEIDHGVFEHVCNVFATRGRDGGFNMLCTAYPDPDGLNKPVWFSRSGESAQPPADAQYDDLVTVKGYETWARADTNGANVLFDTGDNYRLYFNDWKNAGNVYLAESDDGETYELIGSALETSRAVNDVKKFALPGGDVYLMLLHRNADRIWFALSGDGVTFRPENELFMHQSEADRYIVAGGWVTQDDRLLGVLYGAGPVRHLNRNRIFARWLQRRAVFTDESGRVYSPTAAIGPERQLIPLEGDAPLKGTIQIYDVDGQTRIGEPFSVTLRPGHIYDLHQSKTAPRLNAFSDGAKHFKNSNPSDSAKRYRDDQVVEIAENILVHQHDNGGWKSNWDPQRILNADEIAKLQSEKSDFDTTFDNRATYPQIEYLAAAFNQTGDARYRDAALTGLAFMLEAQHASGGFPHSYPSTKNYRPYVTFMDDVTIGALTTLRKAGAGEEPFDFLDPALRKQCKAAATRGLDCVLALQQEHDGRKTVWAGQYHPQTLKPIGARSFELPSLVCAESVGVVRFLQGVKDPSDEVTRAIDSALEWFRASQIKGLRLETFDIEPVRYDHHTATTDRRLVPDTDAPPLWARFYEFDSYKPVMANRDGIKVDSYAEIHPERRSGYAWFGRWPARLLSQDEPGN